MGESRESAKSLARLRVASISVRDTGLRRETKTPAGLYGWGIIYDKLSRRSWRTGSGSGGTRRPCSGRAGPAPSRCGRFWSRAGIILQLQQSLT